MLMKTVVVSGYFNPIHRGHVSLFKEARKLGEKLIVIVNNDKQVLIKGSQAFMDEEERKYILESIRYVDEVVVSIDEDGTQCRTLEMLKPDIFANGGDRKNTSDIPEAKVCERLGIQMIFNVGGDKTQSSSWLLGSVKGPSILDEYDQTKHGDKKVLIADVDETICETCQEISSEMAVEIDRLVKQGYTWAFISGTKVDDLQKMISSKVKEEHHLLATTGTNYVKVTPQGNDLIYQQSFSTEQKQEIMAALDKVITHFDIRAMTTKEDQVQDRDSQITLSAIGRNAPIELKKQYDPDGEKRKVWIGYLQDLLGDRYDYKIGGTTSLDITQKGLDKEWGIKEFAKQNNILLKEILFFGDKIYPGGNDYPASKIVDCIAVKNPEDTLRELRKIP